MSYATWRAKAVVIAVIGSLLSLLFVAAPSRAEPVQVTLGGSTATAVGTNVPRGADQLVLYTRTAAQTSAPTNQWGAEVAVQGGVVVSINDRQTTGAAATVIPTGPAATSFVLSGHGTARVWLLANAAVGAPASYPQSSPPPGPPAGQPVVQADGSWYLLTGDNVARGADQLVRYTRSATQTVTPTNQWGTEATVVNGSVTAVSDRQETGAAATAIPTNGYVLSGHGAARSWMLAHLAVGEAVTTPTPPAPEPQGPTPNPAGWTCSAGTVRLTLDDGPDPTFTPVALDIFKAWNVKVTFFVMGSKVQANPQIVARAYAEGHRIGNHTWDHPSLTKLNTQQVTSQFTRTTDAIVAAGVPRPTEWRPPYEDHNASVRNIASGLGMTMVTWTYDTDTNDWQNISVQQITANGVNNAKNGSIILIHDIRQRSIDALPYILDGLQKKGLCLV